MGNSLSSPLNPPACLNLLFKKSLKKEVIEGEGKQNRSETKIYLTKEKVFEKESVKSPALERTLVQHHKTLSPHQSTAMLDIRLRCSVFPECLKVQPLF